MDKNQLTPEEVQTIRVLLPALSEEVEVLSQEIVSLKKTLRIARKIIEDLIAHKKQTNLDVEKLMLFDIQSAQKFGEVTAWIGYLDNAIEARRESIISNN